jgi:hypothetical protein
MSVTSDATKSEMLPLLERLGAVKRSYRVATMTMRRTCRSSA